MIILSLTRSTLIDLLLAAKSSQGPLGHSALYAAGASAVTSQDIGPSCIFSRALVFVSRRHDASASRFESEPSTWRCCRFKHRTPSLTFVSDLPLRVYILTSVTIAGDAWWMGRNMALNAMDVVASGPVVGSPPTRESLSVVLAMASSLITLTVSTAGDFSGMSLVPTAMFLTATTLPCRSMVSDAIDLVPCRRRVQHLDVLHPPHEVEEGVHGTRNPRGWYAVILSLVWTPR